MKHHLNAKTKDDGHWNSHRSQYRAVVFWRQKAHAMNPNHESCCPPVMVVASCMLGLGVHVTEWYPPRSLIGRLQSQDCKSQFKRAEIASCKTTCSTLLHAASNEVCSHCSHYRKRRLERLLNRSEAWLLSNTEGKRVRYLPRVSYQVRRRDDETFADRKLPERLERASCKAF